MKPIIGILTKYQTNDPHYGWSLMTVSNPLRKAIYDCGGLCVAILPQTTTLNFQEQDEVDTQTMSKSETEDLVSLLNSLDGVILQGGAYSSYYEEFTAKYCHEHNIPLLGICAGYNTMIRALGGSTKRLKNSDHERSDLKFAHYMDVTDKSSLYYSIVNSDRFMVNSIHMYVGDKLPNDLKAVAFSDDGQIEVVEDKSKTFYMGIKHHPELLYQVDQKQKNIFDAFISACSKK